MAPPKQDYQMGLRMCRTPNKNPKGIMYILLADILARSTFLAYLWIAHLVSEEPPIFPIWTVYIVTVEFAIASIFMYRFARWDEHGHLVSLWEVLSSLLAVALRRTLYSNPTFFLVIMLMLPLAYWVGMMTEFWQHTEPRVPPFQAKKVDKSRPNYGWLGKNAARLCQSSASRSAVTAVLFATYLNKIIMLYYFGSISVDSDMIAIGDNLNLLFKMAVVLGALSLLPNIIVDIAVLPEFISDVRNIKKASKGYKTETFEVATIDDDEDLENSELMKRVRATNHKLCGITVVIPCYMPNEEEILDEVLDYYKDQADKYASVGGELKVLVVWNSPDSHPEAEEKMDQREKDWPAFKCFRNLISTSKCDNLNYACDELTTEVALLNDADTMVSVGTFIRASLWITGGNPEDQVDVAQCHSTHCKNDCMGTPEGGFFCFGPLVTMADASKPKNMATQGIFRHSPFNGRGGFWRVSALKEVQFDHWSIGEDHDAMYRGMAYYGFKGIIDPNMLCQEQEPPECASLTKQRIRWETAALEMRRTFPWIVRSVHYSKFEAFVLIWSQLYANANLPLQYMPMQAFMIVPLGITKAFIWKHVFSGDETAKSMCAGEDCLGQFKIGKDNFVIPMAFAAFLLLFAVVFGLWIFDCILRCLSTRYRPQALWCFNTVFIAPITIAPFLTYCQFFALRDYCFGGAKFIPTKRSPTSSRENLLSNSSLDKLQQQASIEFDKAANAPAAGNGLAPMGGLGRKAKGGDLSAPLLGDDAA